MKKKTPESFEIIASVRIRMDQVQRMSKVGGSEIEADVYAGVFNDLLSFMAVELIKRGAHPKSVEQAARKVMADPTPICRLTHE